MVLVQQFFYSSFHSGLYEIKVIFLKYKLIQVIELLLKTLSWFPTAVSIEFSFFDKTYKTLNDPASMHPVLLPANCVLAILSFSLPRM